MRAQVAVLGAGPYGLAAAGALRAHGVDVTVNGQPMSFWARMPRGMLLRSPYVASSIGDPTGPFSLDAYSSATGTPIRRPIPLRLFSEYGRWVQREAVPDLDTREVTRVDRADGAFRLELEDGDELTATRLIVAAGIGTFPRIPAPFRGLPADRVSHASDHPDLGVFAGRRVLVIGAGQSALESAALMAESGAEVQIAARAATVHWLRPVTSWPRRLGPVSTFLYAPAEVGPPLMSRLVEVPQVLSRLGETTRHRVDRRSIRPAGATWLRDRVLGSIPISLGREVLTAEAGTEGVTVSFHDGEQVTVDHVLLGTGYRVDLARYPFLSADLLGRIRQAHGYPVLGAGFESSVPGLHFVGAPAAWRYGPLMRFVAGTAFTVREIGRVATAMRAGRPADRSPMAA